MKTAINFLNIGLFLLVAIFTGCASIGERPHHPSLEASTPPPKHTQHSVLGVFGASMP